MAAASAPAPVAKGQHSVSAPLLTDPNRTTPGVPPDSLFPTLEKSRRPERGMDFQASQGGSIRMVRVDELIDIQDKADFFLSIGQQDQAIAVLEGHVHDQVETSALAWLDLLDMYHSLGKREDFDRLAAEFREQFNAQVPAFEEFNLPTGGLEDYGRALSRIVALWPGARVLELIEESIFRKPGVGGADAFSLEAYRELILLYNIARDVVPESDSGMGELRRGPATDFARTSLDSLASLHQAEPAAVDERFIPPASRNLGLDIDLGGESADEAPTVEPRSTGLGPIDVETGWDDDLAIQAPKRKN